MSKLISCKDCGNEVSQNAKSCPKCGAKVKKPISILQGIGYVLLTFFVLGIICSVANSPTTPVQAAARIASSGLTLQDGWKCTRDEYGTAYITGYVKNSSPKNFSYVQIQFNLYDKNGSIIGSALANVNNLDANGTWRFKAVCLEDHFSQVQFKELTGF